MHALPVPPPVAALALASLLLCCPTQAVAAKDPCSAPKRDTDACSRRAGHCFDLRIGGQHTRPLTDAALRASLQEAVDRPVCWTLPAPVAGDLATEIVRNARSHLLGAQRAPLELVITGLEGQSVPTRKSIRTDPTVRIGGMPMQTVVDEIDTAALPPGAYVVQVRFVGTANWDQQLVHLTVEEPGAQPATHLTDN